MYIHLKIINLLNQMNFFFFFLYTLGEFTLLKHNYLIKSACNEEVLISILLKLQKKRNNSHERLPPKLENTYLIFLPQCTTRKLLAFLSSLQKG